MNGIRGCPGRYRSLGYQSPRYIQYRLVCRQDGHRSQEFEASPSQDRVSGGGFLPDQFRYKQVECPAASVPPIARDLLVPGDE
jgi:hypothetical protein